VIRHAQLGVDRPGTGHVYGIKAAHLSDSGSQGIMGTRRHENVFPGYQLTQPLISGRHISFLSHDEHLILAEQEGTA
jgi:hypothetical protein